MKVLVTGGAGFIGSHLCRRLLADGREVSIVDNESTGRRDNVPAAARYTRGDVTRSADLEPLFAAGLDAVCHVAGQVSIIRSFRDPVADLRTNTEGTLNVLQLCLKYRVPRLLYASSMTVYGDCRTIPTSEEEPCRPDSYYGITKYAAERYVHATAARADLGFAFRVTSLRMYSVFGPVQALDNPYPGVLGIYLGNLLRGEPLTIFGDGEQSRDFVYIDDIVHGWALALDNPASHGVVLNLGTGRALTINQLADSALAAFGRTRADYPVHYQPGRPGEQRTVQADPRRARTVLGWAPQVAFEEGLAATVRWARASAQKPGGER